MTTINIQENLNPTKYLVITQQKDPETLITTRVLITDNANNRINVVDIGRGPIGPPGPAGPQGLPGQNGASFDILSISSGGTNNNNFVTNKIIYYDGNKLTSTEYSTSDLINNINAITGIIEGSGIAKSVIGNNVIINANVGDGLSIDSNNQIIVDDTIARKFEISLGSISGILPILKGGTNSSFFNTNRLVYFDGNKLSSFPLETGRILTSGTTISVVAGSGLVGGGSISIPGGSVVLDIGNSEDIIVTDFNIQLSTTGSPGLYSKVLTDTKGRVISGAQLSSSDITNALGYTPYHPGNDGSGSLLDADLLDGRQGDYYLNFSNFTGSIQTNLLPDIIVPSTFTKVATNSKGLVISGTGLNFADVITGLNYIPVSTSGDTINGDLEVIGNFNVQNGNVVFEDNLPLFSFNNESMLPTDPRGFSFEYGTAIKRTGILAYFPADQQLKLIVNIISDGDNDIDGGEGGTNFNDDIDGGDASSIFVLGSIVGEESIVLLEHIADQKYISLTQNQTISGIKTFVNALNVYNYLNVMQTVNYDGPPIFVGSNTGLVTNFNSDLLDGHHGSYYRDAINLTGILDYNSVEVTNLDGLSNFIPKFNNLTSNPSRTLDNSIIQQPAPDLISIATGSLSIGNNSSYQNKTLLVGNNNSTLSQNSTTIGHSNTTSGDFSVAIGSGAYTWLDNQLSIGAFVELSGATPLGRAQTSTTAIGYYGDTGGTYRTLEPVIKIPRDKTALYNIDLLFSKFGSSGLATISFHSGLIKNVNGNCFVINSGHKSELYNNSQIRDYIYTARNTVYELSENQLLSVTSTPLRFNSGEIQNLSAVNKIRLDRSYQNGSFYKMFDGNIAIDLNEPITTGTYITQENFKTIIIDLYEHECVTGCFISFVPLSGTNILPLSGMYEIRTIDNNQQVKVNDIPWSGHYSNGSINIPFASVNQIDNIAQNNFIFSGSFSNNSTEITNCSPSPSGRIFDGMKISAINFAGVPEVTGVTSNSIFLSIAYTGLSSSHSFSIDDYSIYKIDQCDKIFLEGGGFAQPISITGNIDTTASGLRIYTSGFSGPSNISPINIFATLNSSGLIYATRKRNYEATYSRATASFDTYTLLYIQEPSQNNTGIITFSSNRAISGYADNYNPYFKFLSASNTFSGILTSGSNIITNCVPIQSGKLASGMILYSSISGFSTTGNLITITPTGNSITLNTVFSGINNSGFITYSGYIPDNNYEILETTISGLSVKTVYNPPDSGIYLSGTAIMYNGTGVSDIAIQTIDLCNLQAGTSGYLRFTSTNRGLLPIDGTYEISDTSIGSFDINNYHLMPDSGISATGFVKLNLNKDHGFLPPGSVNYLSQDVPIKFDMAVKYTGISGVSIPTYGGNENIYRTPNSGLYNIKAVSGYRVLVNDFNRVLVDENNKELFLDTFRRTTYEATDSSNNQLSLLYDNRYLNLNDSIFLSFPNQTQYSQNFRITGIRDSGLYGYLDLRTISGSLTGIVSLSPTGFVDYIGSCSGSVERFYNLVYLNYAGDTFENWKRDSSGVYIDPPLTGYFWVYDSPSLCYSGNLCIHISGISNINSIQPSESFYFDFIDADSSLDGIYQVNDKINPSVLSLSIPYNSSYLNNSGLVHIIRSSENIKTNKNPNLNNNFINTTLQINNASNYIGSLSKFNIDTNNKWKYGIILKDSLSPQKMNQQVTVGSPNFSDTNVTDVIVFAATSLFADIEYSLDKTNFYNAESSPFSIADTDTFYIKAIVYGGAGNWSNGTDESCPRINVLGVSSYNIFAQDRTFNNVTGKWEIIITCNPINRVVSNKQIELIISDISSRISKNIYLNAVKKLSATPIDNIQYGYANDISNWFMLLETYGGSLSPINQPFVQVVSGFPNDAGVQVNVEYLNYPSGWWGISLQGLPPSTTGIYNPVIAITETLDPTSTIQVTGTLFITNTDQNYELKLRTISNNINIPFIDNNVDDFGFLVPIWTDSDANFTVNFNSTDGLTFGNPTIEYRPNLKCFGYRVNISGFAGFYQPTFTVGINQPSGIENPLFTKTSGIDVTIYNPIYVNLTEYAQPVEFAEDTRWNFAFYVQDGGVAYRNDIEPSVYIGNAPNIGTYNTFPLEYIIAKRYDSINSRWVISISGLPDQFGSFVSSTGLFTTKIYIEDYTTSNTNTLDIDIIPKNNFVLQDRVFSTPNNGFQFALDFNTPKSTLIPSVEFPSNLKDALIIPTKTYSKYDNDIKIWEYNYSGSPIVEKWDAKLELIDNDLIVKAKGILNDKIYVAGKVETIETNNQFTIFKPLKILDVNEEYDIDEGDRWELEFSTEGGLENPLYPPKIIMQGFPDGSQCAGYDPNEESQPPCFVTRTWNQNTKEWLFRFQGLPLCIKDVQFNITITAIDTIDEQTFGTDIVTTIFSYEAIEDHPPPRPPQTFNRELFPQCLSYYDENTYGISIRDICPVPTGLTGLITWGTLPPGLSFSDTRAGQYVSPWSDLTGGTAIIEGFPTTFASGGDYPNVFNIAVFDARGRSGVLSTITFTDASVAIDPSPTEMTIYFSGLDYVYTPSLPTSNQPILGGAHIDDSLPQDMLRPPASNLSMQCLSKLPHNQCLYSTGIYTVVDADTINLLGPGTDFSLQSHKRISAGDRIYLEFDNQVSSLFNKEYIAIRPNSLSINIISSGHGISSLISGEVGVLKTQGNIKSLSVKNAGYGGNPATIPTFGTTTGIMGDGKYTVRNSNRGFQGRIKPSFSGDLKGGITGIYRTIFTHHEDMRISGIPNISNNVYSIEFVNCYETGYLRVSGVILPTPVLEISDPPPAASPFAFNNQDYALAPRIAYGENATTRDKTENRRQGKQILPIVYALQNNANNIYYYNQLSIVTTPNPFTYVSPSLNSGLVLVLDIKHDSQDKFPTYNKQAMPSLTNEYFWIQRAGAQNDPINESTFPPHIPTYRDSLLFVSGEVINKNIDFVGGYIDPSNPSQYQNYLPYVSGFIQNPIANIVPISGTYIKNFSSSVISITIEDNPLISGDIVKISAVSSSEIVPVPFNTTGVILDNILGNVINISGDFPPSVMGGQVFITPAARISSGEMPHQIKINYSNISESGNYTINKCIDIVTISNEQLSTQNYFMPNDYRLNIISGTQYAAYAGIDALVVSGTLTNSSPIISNCSVNPEFILKPGYSLYADIAGFPNPATVSSVTSNSITLNQNYTGSTTNNVKIIHSGVNITNYYDYLINTMSGISIVNENLYNKTNNKFDINFSGVAYENKPGYTTAPITGYSDNLFGYYTYKVISAENTGIPTIVSSGWNNKKYSKSYEMINTIPLTITENASVFSNIDIENNSWFIQFHVTGGFIPKNRSNIITEIDDTIHTFTQSYDYVSDSGVKITISSNPGISNWSGYFVNNIPEMVVFDRIGSDSRFLTAVFE